MTPINLGVIGETGPDFTRTHCRKTDIPEKTGRLYHFEPGQRIGMMTLIAQLPTPSNGKWTVRCDCGIVKVVVASRLALGRTISCGCYAIARRREATQKHGHGTKEKTPTYRSWQHMHNRCSNPGQKHYFGKGITVCEEWKSFAQFLKDMGERPAGTSIDRINSNLGYSPRNCRWASPGLQSANTSRAKLDPQKAMELYSMRWKLSSREAGQQFGISYHTVLSVWHGRAWKEFTQVAA